MFVYVLRLRLYFPREARDLDLVCDSSTAPPSNMLERWFFLRFWAARDAMGFVRGGFIEISGAARDAMGASRGIQHTRRM